MRLLFAALLVAGVARADTILPGQTSPAPRGVKGGVRGGHPRGDGSAGFVDGDPFARRDPPAWLAPCMARMESVRGRLQRREQALLKVRSSAEAETVILESRCADDGRVRVSCDSYWAMVSVYDQKHEAPVAWSNHKNGAQTGAWDLRRRGARLEGWVEVTGDRGASAIPALQRAVDACLALGDGAD